MTDMQRFKKEFQKAVKAYRDTLPNEKIPCPAGRQPREVRPEYPKAMLTARQAEKKTATINMGRWVTASNKKLEQRINDLKAFIPFRDWCNQYHVTIAGVEHDSYGSTSLRLYY